MAGINIIFVNIDWKKSRHDTFGSNRRNLRLLNATIASIVDKMKPAVICCCEVGQVSQPMTLPQIDEMKQTFRNAWKMTFLSSTRKVSPTSQHGIIASVVASTSGS